MILECRVRGEPEPSITWTRDNEFIQTSDKYTQIDQADGLCRLIIYNPDVRDSGAYTCKAENSAGADKTTHNVIFEGCDSYINQKTHGFYHRDPLKPQFQNMLGDHLVTAGGTIGLQAELIHDVTEVQWLREKAPLSIGAKAQTLYDHGVYTLVIPKATDDMDGTYTCRAINAFGKTEASAHVHVVGPSIRGGKCPLFTIRPDAEMKIQTGDPFSFSFKVIGEPQPKCKQRRFFFACLHLNLFYLTVSLFYIVSLLKGIRDITQSDRTQKEGLEDSLRYTIQQSKPGDSGTYCVLARNQHGTDRAFVTITVKSPKKKADESEPTA